jgi:serine/threonine protein kinase
LRTLEGAVSEEIWAAPVGLVPGSRIAGYVLEEQIGRGGMAVVFRARDERLGRQVALKFLSPWLAADEAFRKRFIRESRTAAAVDDPHIIPVFEAGEANGVLFIAMRYVPGGDVGSLIPKRGLPPAQVAEIVSQVASALDKAHRQGLVHRDVKPSNMLLDAGSGDGGPVHVYLSDFGLSKAVAGADSLTRAGQVLGTFAYAAPEQIEGKPVDGQADEYALACAAYELLCGEPPFVGDDAIVLGGHLYQQPARLSSRQPILPPAVDAVFEQALAKAPSKRYPSCHEFSDALRGALSSARATTKTGDRSSSGRGTGRSGRSRTAAVIAVAAVAAAVGLLVWAPWNTQSVLRPTGLRADASTTGSVTLSWSDPSGGAAPDRYVIWQDSVAIGSVSGNAVSYQVRGLAPDTAYHYQVQAVRGSDRSPRSTTLTENTQAPPITAARLVGLWFLGFRVVTASIVDPYFNSVGKTWSTTWTFTPDCGSGACNVTLNGSIVDDHSFTATLYRVGATYSGTFDLSTFEDCGGTDTEDLITIQLTVSTAHTDGMAWTANGWTGTFTMSSPPTQSQDTSTGDCPAYTVGADLSS